jgi:hypothetical protein
MASWLPWAVSVLLKHLLRIGNVSFIRRDIFDAELPHDAIVVCYLFPRAMRRVQRKLIRGHWSPAAVVTHTFALPSLAAWATLPLRDLYRSRIHVYLPASWRGPGAG